MTWVGIIFTSLGLITSVYYHDHILKATRLESEMNSYLNLNQRYHQLLFSLVHNQAFRNTGGEIVKDDKYVIYELFDLISTVKTLENYFTEAAPDIKADWERKIDFLLSKRAVQQAWKERAEYIDKIYNASFITYVEQVIALHRHEE